MRKSGRETERERVWVRKQKERERERKGKNETTHFKDVVLWPLELKNQSKFFSALFCCCPFPGSHILRFGNTG